MDESQWLPKGTAIINPERQAKLNISVEYAGDGSIKYAKAQEPITIMAYLYRNGTLDDAEYQAGKEYQMAREIFRSFTSRQRMTASYGDATPSWVSEDFGRERVYSMIVRMMPRSYQSAIDYAVDAVTRERKHIPVDTFQRAFGRLAGVMDCIQKEIDAQREMV